MKTKPMKKTLIIIAGAILLILVASYVVTKCNSSKQGRLEISNAELQGKNEILESYLLILQGQLNVHIAAEDSLYVRVKEQDSMLTLTKSKYAVIARKYDLERSKVKELTNDSAVGLFLDRADCSEVPVVKYENDYIVPVEPIRFYNDLAVGFDEQVSVNENLRNENTIKDMKIRSLESICSNKEDQVQVLTKIIATKDQIIANKDTAIGNDKKLIRAEHRKVIASRIAGIAYGVVSTAVLVWVVVR